ncbi:MAG: DEAD/DEAH box helicase [Cytophagaceae bacterium]
MIQELLRNLQIPSLNDVQQATLDASDTQENILLLSPTGTGKTLAFLLPVYNSLDLQISDVQVIILVPSRELALQIESVFRKMASGFKVSCCYGGHPFSVEKQNLHQPPAVLVGTPGRIADHIQRGSVDVSKANTLVLDEFDKSLELGFAKEMTYIIQNLKSINKRYLTSATKLETLPSFLGVENFFEINFLTGALPAGLNLKVVQSKVKAKEEHLFNLICSFKNSQSLIFCNHREIVENVQMKLQSMGLTTEMFHGGMDQVEREKALVKFKNGSSPVLVCTDLAARGLDISEVKFIVHYQLPLDQKSFIHRNGRTARMNTEGVSYIFLTENEYLPGYIPKSVQDEKLLSAGRPITPEWVTLYISFGKKDKINKVDIVGFILQNGKLDKSELGKIEVQDRISFAAVARDKAASLLAQLNDKKIKNKKVKVEIAR